MKARPIACSRGTGAFRPLRRRLLASVSALALAGCAARAPQRRPADALAGPPDRLADARYALLGEVHDNPRIHRLRLDWLRQLTASRRCALAMEQFDAAMQAQLDRARGQGLGARALAEAAGFSFEGWDWALYEPVVELALQRGLPLVAANLSAREANAVARRSGQKEPPDLRPGGWTGTDEAEMARAIRDGHCGLLPEASVAALVRAQLARDRAIASSMTQAHRRHRLPVVLLAGNGHVRTDIGVPRHLRELDPSAALVAVGIGEQDRPLSGRYDLVVDVDPVERPDPCEALRRRFGQAARFAQPAAERGPRSPSTSCMS